MAISIYGLGSAHPSYETQEVPLQPGLNEVTLRARPACGVRVLLTEADAKLIERYTFALDWKPKAIGTDDVDRCSESYLHRGLEILVSEPGHYRVLLPDLPNCEPIAPFEVDVVSGVFVEHALALSAKR